jgi:RNA polymerase sigma-70 factor (ECF subfamily)
LSRHPPDQDDSKRTVPPHTDPAQWDVIIEDIRPASMLVLISSAMSKSLRAQYTPEDIWQETLAQAWSAREKHRWEGLTAFRAWIFEIARNRIRDAARSLDAMKRGGGRPAARFSELASGRSRPTSSLFPSHSVTPSRILMHAERAAAIQKALTALPPDLEAIVRMHLVEELTMEVIAARLGISVSAAWRRFRRGSELYSRMLPDLKSSRITRRN